MSAPAGKRRALCCECGEVRTVSRNHYPRTAGIDLDWDGVGNLKCSHCGVVTRHAFLRDDDSAEPAAAGMTSPADPVEAINALGVTVCWISDMRRSGLWLPDQRIVILNAQLDLEEILSAVQALLPQMTETQW